MVRDALDQLDAIAAIREDARLIASELVTNAVVHSACGDDQTIEVRASLAGDVLTISVDDPCMAGKTAQIRAEDESGTGGFGLRIVQRLARKWGSERPNGHLVWAEIALT
jgi:anti-sigma regulatory factor (Ser/Thr protein kinase)